MGYRVGAMSPGQGKGSVPRAESEARETCVCGLTPCCSCGEFGPHAAGVAYSAHGASPSSAAGPNFGTSLLNRVVTPLNSVKSKDL